MGRHTDVHPFLKSPQSWVQPLSPGFHHHRRVSLLILTFVGILRKEPASRLLEGHSPPPIVSTDMHPLLGVKKKKSRKRIKCTYPLVLFSIKHIRPFRVRRCGCHWFCAPGDKPQVSACSERFHNINNFFSKSLICFPFRGRFDTAGWGLRAWEFCRGQCLCASRAAEGACVLLSRSKTGSCVQPGRTRAPGSAVSGGSRDVKDDFLLSNTPLGGRSGVHRGLGVFPPDLPPRPSAHPTRK